MSFGDKVVLDGIDPLGRHRPRRAKMVPSSHMLARS